MNGELIHALRQIEKERNIPLFVLQEAVESALSSSYRKNFDEGQHIRIAIDWESGGAIKVVGTKTVVNRRKDPVLEISLSQAKKDFESGEIRHVYPPAPEKEEKEKEVVEESEIEEILKPIENPTVDDIVIGARVDVVVDENPKKFGRIAAQTTKQVIMQKIREAERDIIFYEYAKRQGEVISVTVQRNEHRNWVCDLDKVEGVIPPQEQVASEHFRRGERIKAYVLAVEKTPKGPQIILSRTHPGLIRNLFEMEVPEIGQGLVEIHNVARESGARSKVSVKALERNIDPVGACVGPRGSRVQMVVDELRGEKIDIISYTDDPFTFVSNSLSPAKVLTVTLNPDDRSALVIVPDGQFSLAIGKEGQNARLAAKLTNWKIDIKSESQAKDLESHMISEDERKRREEEQRALKEAEEKKRREEEEARRKKEEDEKRRKRQEEEKKRREEEELKKLREYQPQFDDEENLELMEAPEKDKKKEKEIEEALKHIPDDIPVEQYVAMAFGNEEVYRSDYYSGRSDEEEDRPKKKKKKKKQRREREFGFDR